MSVEKNFVHRRTNRCVLFLLVLIITILFINIFIYLAKSYADSAETITSITPNSGSIIGGDTVTILGSGFDSNDMVMFGNHQAEIVNVSSDKTTMTVIIPASISDGAVDVVVFGSFGQIVDPSGFTYADPFTAISLDPSSGPISGGQTVTASGTGFYQNLKFNQILKNEEWSDATCGISTGKVYCWGRNNYGQLGNGDTTGATQYSPVAVDMSGVLKGKTITQISGSNLGTIIALASDGTVYGWGANNYGQLGNGDTTGANQYSPVAVDMSGVLKGKTITQISSSFGTIIALASDGTAYSWGDNADGQLGNGTTNARQFSPVAVDMSGVLKGKTITQISTGD